MKRFKKVFVLLGVLVVACVATWIVMHTEEKKEKIKNTDQEILRIAAKDVTSLSWKYDNVSLAFEKGDRWKWKDDEAFPVDEDKVNELLDIFSSFGAGFAIEDVEDYSQYGLSQPTCTITIDTAEKEYQILLGAYSTMDSQRYVSVGDGNVYLVKTDPFDSYEIEISDMLKRDELPNFDEILSVEVSGSENYTITYVEDSKETYCSDDLFFTQKNGKNVPLDTELLDEYTSNISRLPLENYVSYKVTDEELKAWGLANPELTLKFHYSDNDEDGNKPDEAQTFLLSLGRNQEELTEKMKAEINGEEYSGTVTAYVRINDSPIVYQISEDNYEILSAAGYNDLRHTDLYTAPYEAITGLDISLDGVDYRITSGYEEGNSSRTYYHGEDVVNLVTFRNKVRALEVMEFTDEQPKDKEEISVTFYIENNNYTEMTLQLYRYDGTYCLAVVNGETVGLVSRTNAMALVEAAYTFTLG